MTEISKTDLFAIFNKFNSKTFTPNIYKVSFRKASLILLDLSIVLFKMKDFKGI